MREPAGCSIHHTLFIADMAIARVINGGTPRPALLRMTVPIGGLPLP